MGYDVGRYAFPRCGRCAGIIYGTAVERNGWTLHEDCAVGVPSTERSDSGS